MKTFMALDARYADVFTALVQIDPHYVGEVGTSGDRSLALQALENRLRQAFAAARGHQLAGRSPQVAEVTGGAGRVRQLAAWHSGQMDAARDKVQGDLNQAVIRLRTWLSRQGAWFGPDGSVLWPQTMRYRVIYDHDMARQAATKVTISGGLLIDAKRRPIDTAGYVTHFSGPGKAIYVMSATGNLHLNSHSVGHYHHSSLLAGIPVACAGEIEIKNGRIVWLSHKSGHYKPAREQLLQVLAMLQRRGVDLSFALSAFNNGTWQRFPSVEAYMLSERLDDASIIPVHQALSLVVPSSYTHYATITFKAVAKPSTGTGGNYYTPSH